MLLSRKRKRSLKRSKIFKTTRNKKMTCVFYLHEALKKMVTRPLPSNDFFEQKGGPNFLQKKRSIKRFEKIFQVQALTRCSLPKSLLC